MPAAAPNTGKTAQKFQRLLVGGANLSGDLLNVGDVGIEYDAVNVGGIVNDAEYLAGQGRVSFGPMQAVFNNKVAAAGVSAGSHTQLTALAASNTHGTLAIGVRAAPAIGNPAFSCVIQEASYKVQRGSGAVLLDASFEVVAGATVNMQANGWGSLLADGTNLTATTTNDYIDNGSASSNGAWAVLHVDSPADTMSSPVWAFTIEDSADALSWATIITFTANGATLTSEALYLAGTIRRYARFVATKTSGSNVRPWVNFIRL